MENTNAQNNLNNPQAQNQLPTNSTQSKQQPLDNTQPNVDVTQQPQEPINEPVANNNQFVDPNNDPNHSTHPVGRPIPQGADVANNLPFAQYQEEAKLPPIDNTQSQQSSVTVPAQAVVPASTTPVDTKPVVASATSTASANTISNADSTKVPTTVNLTGSAVDAVSNTSDTSTSGKDSTKKIKSSKSKLPLIIGILLILGLVGGVGFYFLSNGTSDPEPLPVEEPVEPEPVEPNAPPDEEQLLNDSIGAANVINYRNDQYEFAFNYPKNSTLTENNVFSDDPASYNVAFGGERQETDIIFEQDLVDGYLFKVVVSENLIIDDLFQIANEKRKRYTVGCNTRTVISNISNITFLDTDATTFSVTGCTQDYVETFVKRGDLVFEIIQVYVGDIGFRQAYRSITEEIKASFEFTNIVEPNPIEVWDTYTSSGDGIELRHPSMDTRCCNVSGPPVGDFRKTVVLAEQGSVDRGIERSFNGFGIYTSANQNRIPYDEFVQIVKESLIENYRIVVGLNPDPSEELVQVGDQQGILLRNHAWWGDIVIVQHPTKPQIYAFSTTEKEDGAFDELFSRILSTVVFL